MYLLGVFFRRLSSFVLPRIHWALKSNCLQWNYVEKTCSQTLVWQRTRCVCVRACVLTVRDTGTGERTHRLRPLPWPRSEMALSRGGGQLEGSMAYIATGHMGWLNTVQQLTCKCREDQRSGSSSGDVWFMVDVQFFGFFWVFLKRKTIWKLCLGNKHIVKASDILRLIYIVFNECLSNFLMIDVILTIQWKLTVWVCGSVSHHPLLLVLKTSM